MEEGDPRLILKEWWSELKGEQRFSVIILGVCSVAALGFSVQQFYTKLRSPFMVPVAALKESQNYQQAQALAAQEREAARSKDTDHDGLTDDEELNVYRTSPYLADTDSDGVSDFIEVQKGTDPNCPSDRVCAVQIEMAATDASSTLSNGMMLPPRVDVVGNLLGGAASGTAVTAETPPPPDQITPTELRAYLISRNMIGAEELKTLSDDQIMTVYRAAYADAMRGEGVTEAP